MQVMNIHHLTKQSMSEIIEAIPEIKTREIHPQQPEIHPPQHFPKTRHSIQSF